MQPEPIADGVQAAPDSQFRLGILPRIAAMLRLRASRLILSAIRATLR